MKRNWFLILQKFLKATVTTMVHAKSRKKTAGTGETDISPQNRTNHETGRTGINVYNCTIQTAKGQMQ